MTITVTYDGIEERDEAIDAISIGDYRHVIAEFDIKLRGAWKYGGQTDETRAVVRELWLSWNDLTADLPRGGE